MKDLIQRSLSGIIYVLAIFLLLWMDSLSMFIFCLLVNFFALKEFYHLSYRTKSLPYKVTGILGGSLLVILAYLSASGAAPGKILLLSFLALPVITIPVLFYHPPVFYKAWGATLTGLIYISIPLALVSFISFRDSSYQYTLLLSVFIIIWIYDSFAYLIGTLIGKHRIFPSISPKKSWEGAIGGLVFAAGGSYLLFKIFGTLTAVQWILLAVILVITATLGDFTESALKRNARVKDSGKFLPGHGGVLDRFDSFLFSIPFVFVYIYMLN